MDGTDFGEIEAALQPNTTLIYLESPSTALYLLQDLAAVARLPKGRGITTITDNSWATALLQRPLELGIDLDVYSATITWAVTRTSWPGRSWEARRS